MKIILGLCALLVSPLISAGLLGGAKFMPKTLKISYEQSFRSITGKSKSSQGELMYQRFGQLRLKEFKDNTEFVANKETSWYYVPPFKKGEKGTVQVNSAKNNSLIKVLDSLREGLQNNDFYQVKELKVDQFLLEFKPTYAKEFKLKSVELSFRKIVLPDATDHNQKNTKVLAFRDLESMSLQYEDGKKVDFKLLKIEEDISFPARFFEFQVPANTQIIKN